MVETDLPDHPPLTISFRKGDTPAPACMELADFMYGNFMTPTSPGRKFGRYQDGCSIIVIPGSYEGYLNGPAGYATRRKLRRAEREGYAFQEIDPAAWTDDIYAVNTSLDTRQGRPMDASYRSRPTNDHDPALGCPRHREVWFGVVKDGHVVAYTHVYQVGEMCLYSRILGHGDHMESGIMYQLVAGVIEALTESAGLRYAMYERHTSGTPGLQFFKERMGFRPYWVDWQLADEPVVSTRPAFRAAALGMVQSRGVARRLVVRLRRAIRSRLPS